MVVGVCRVELSLPGNSSLKGKRAVLRRIIDRGRNRFNAAIAEVGRQDQLDRASIAFAVLSNDGRHANSMVDTMLRFVEGASEALVIDRRMEIVHIGETFDCEFDVGSDDEDGDESA